MFPCSRFVVARLILEMSCIVNRLLGLFRVPFWLGLCLCHNGGLSAFVSRLMESVCQSGSAGAEGWEGFATDGMVSEDGPPFGPMVTGRAESFSLGEGTDPCFQPALRQ